jgi:hypothetical protein
MKTKWKWIVGLAGVPGACVVVPRDDAGLWLSTRRRLAPRSGPRRSLALRSGSTVSVGAPGLGLPATFTARLVGCSRRS